MTPLLLAAKNGHTDVVKILLQQDDIDAQINLKNLRGHNFLCEAIFSGHQYVIVVASCVLNSPYICTLYCRATVIAIINSDKHWEQAMKFKTCHNETPMRLLVELMPGKITHTYNCFANALCIMIMLRYSEVAEMVLTRCVSVVYKTDYRDHPRSHYINYSFDFLDDFYVPYDNVREFMEHTGLLHYIPDILSTCTGRTDSGRVERGSRDHMEWMQPHYDPDNHVLKLMVSVIHMNETTVNSACA